MYETFYFTVSKGWIQPEMLAVPVLLSAASFARRCKGLPDVTLPLQVPEVAVDCGGFAATFMYGGSYPFTPEQYVEWLARIHPTPTWAAMFDLCCSAEVVRARQQWTTEMARYFWNHFPDRPWAWVPTIQGYQASDYIWHARQLRPQIEDMLAYYGPTSAFRVGIGSLCKRANFALIQEVVNAVAEELPRVGFHLWGIKAKVLANRVALPPSVQSSDSSAWSGHFGRGIEERRRSGKPERTWAWEDSAPAYNRKITAALEQDIKQFSLFDWGKEERET